MFKIGSNKTKRADSKQQQWSKGVTVSYGGLISKGGLWTTMEHRHHEYYQLAQGQKNWPHFTWKFKYD